MITEPVKQEVSVVELGSHLHFLSNLLIHLTGFHTELTDKDKVLL
jgi:hypothetical protein